MKFSHAIVLDLETTIRAPKPHFGATPNWPENKIVAVGLMTLHYCDSYRECIPQETTKVILADSISAYYSELNRINEVIWGAPFALVGHNIGFDLQYLMQAERVNAFKKHGCEQDWTTVKPLFLWDTMKFHHIQTGRGNPNPSLEKVAAWWKIPFKKDTEIKERFKAGIGADQIDEALLYEYLEGDVRATAEIFAKQKEYCTQQGEKFTNYILEMMKSIETTTSISNTGLSFDVLGATKERDKLEEELTLLEETFKKKWEKYWVEDAETAFNPGSPLQIETLLWGGNIKVPLTEVVKDEDGEPVLYKTGARKGQVKTRKATTIQYIEPLVQERIINLFKRKGWETKSSAQTLSNLVKYEKDIAGAFAKDILKLRNKAKSITTYYKPYLNFAVNGTIHPSYNHCVTQTGRLSSSKPNMQNINSKDNRQ